MCSTSIWPHQETRSFCYFRTTKLKSCEKKTPREPTCKLIRILFSSSSALFSSFISCLSGEIKREKAKRTTSVEPGDKNTQTNTSTMPSTCVGSSAAPQRTSGLVAGSSAPPASPGSEVSGAARGRGLTPKRKTVRRGDDWK